MRSAESPWASWGQLSSWKEADSWRNEIIRSAEVRLKAFKRGEQTRFNRISENWGESKAKQIFEFVFESSTSKSQMSLWASPRLGVQAFCLLKPTNIEAHLLQPLAFRSKSLQVKPPSEFSKWNLQVESPLHLQSPSITVIESHSKSVKFWFWPERKIQTGLLVTYQMPFSTIPVRFYGQCSSIFSVFRSCPKLLWGYFWWFGATSKRLLEILDFFEATCLGGPLRGLLFNISSPFPDYSRVWSPDYFDSSVARPPVLFARYCPISAEIAHVQSVSKDSKAYPRGRRLKIVANFKELLLENFSWSSSKVLPKKFGYWRAQMAGKRTMADQ